MSLPSFPAAEAVPLHPVSARSPGQQAGKPRRAGAGWGSPGDAGPPLLASRGRRGGARTPRAPHPLCSAPQHRAASASLAGMKTHSWSFSGRWMVLLCAAFPLTFTQALKMGVRKDAAAWSCWGCHRSDTHAVASRTWMNNWI